jgi:hypothetical protein
VLERERKASKSGQGTFGRAEGRHQMIVEEDRSTDVDEDGKDIPQRACRSLHR